METQNKITTDIISWVSSKSLLCHPTFKWRAGIGTIKDVKTQRIKSLIELEHKHFKSWKTDNHLTASSILNSLKKRQDIECFEPTITSKPNKYIFIYKSRTKNPQAVSA